MKGDTYKRVTAWLRGSVGTAGADSIGGAAGSTALGDLGGSPIGAIAQAQQLRQVNGAPVDEAMAAALIVGRGAYFDNSDGTGAVAGLYGATTAVIEATPPKITVAGLDGVGLCSAQYATALYRHARLTITGVSVQVGSDVEFLFRLNTTTGLCYALRFVPLFGQWQWIDRNVMTDVDNAILATSGATVPVFPITVDVVGATLVVKGNGGADTYLSATDSTYTGRGRVGVSMAFVGDYCQGFAVIDRPTGYDYSALLP